MSVALRPLQKTIGAVQSVARLATNRTSLPLAQGAQSITEEREKACKDRRLEKLGGLGEKHYLQYLAGPYTHKLSVAVNCIHR